MVIKLGGDYVKQAFTQVDNLFLSDYMPSANGDDVKIYLTGLMLASSGFDGDYVKKISSTLKITEERVTEGFAYWEKQGLTETRGDSVYYMSVKTPLPPVVRFNTQKFKVFTEETVRIFPDKILTPNEYNRYFEFMTSSGMEVNAMLLIMQYCKEQGGGRTSTDYVLTVASAWAKDGLLKEKQIISRVEELEAYSEDLRLVFAALGIKRAPTFDDRQLFSSWQKEYGFTLNAILTAAKALKKRGGTERLDAYLKELSAARALTASEIEEYAKRKQSVRELCVKICKNIGVYYSNTDSVEEVYVMPWLGLGFDADALERLSKYCFLRNARDLESMNQMVNKFASLGIFSSDDIASYVDRQIKLDEKIRRVYSKCGYIGSISNKDRENYRAWEEWGFDEDVIFAVAENFSDKNFPMSSINRTLGELRNRGIFTVQGAIDYMKDEKGRTKTPSKDADGYEKHMYSEEQLKHAFVNFDNWD
ncbi:MAG: DnaD domain protein [Christensenellales bacterium]